MGDKYGNSRMPQADDPPNSRLFIVGNKKLNENDFREAFSQFGEIEDIWVVKDKRTGENKGVTYVKYEKTSEAANALEAMNGKVLPGTDRNIKVMIASNRNKGSQREENENEKINRLFVLIPKSMTETELDTYFRQFGDVDYVDIVRNKTTRESKGFAYIKYYKFSHAAKAFEECDRKYKAVFSEPRKPNMSRHNMNMNMNMNNDFNVESRQSSTLSIPPFTDSSPRDDKCYRLMVIGSPYLTEDQLWKLFNIVPGMEFCELRYETAKRRAIGTVVYTSIQWASYACEKLHGFEYPTGSRLIVKPDGTTPRLGPSRNTSSLGTPDCPNWQQLAETIAQATSLIQNAGNMSPGGQGPGLNWMKNSNSTQNVNTTDISEICSVPLPSPKPLADVDAEMEARCFVVCTPPPPPPAILRDIFSRFGNLIEVYMLANKNCGYAKYASKKSAEEAMKVLHGAAVCGGRMKVLEAEERGDNARKRQKLDSDAL